MWFIPLSPTILVAQKPNPGHAIPLLDHYQGSLLLSLAHKASALWPQFCCIHQFPLVQPPSLCLYECLCFDGWPVEFYFHFQDW